MTIRGWHYFGVSFLIAVAGTLGTAWAQSGINSVTVHVVATDRHGKPATDLKANELQVTEGNTSLAVRGLKPSEGKEALPVVILFDMVDLDFGERQQQAYFLKQSIAELPFATPIYLYFLGRQGQVYSVIPVSGAPMPVGTGGRDIAPLVDKALEQLAGSRMPDMKVTSIRSREIYEALETVRVEMGRKAGRKQLLWISRGLPSNIKLFDGWHDFKPALQHLAARFNATDTCCTPWTPV